MITIKLTYKQYQACRYWAVSRHMPYLAAACLASTGKTRLVTMPYPGWQALQRLLAQQAFDRWGRVQRRKLADDKTSGTASALHAISRKLSKAAGHPAMRGEIVIGYSADEFIAWPVNETAQAPWALWPFPGKPAFMLLPKFEPNPVVQVGAATMRFREGITYWIPCGPPDADLLAEHLGWLVDEDEATGT